MMELEFETLRNPLFSSDSAQVTDSWFIIWKNGLGNDTSLQTRLLSNAMIFSPLHLAILICLPLTRRFHSHLSSFYALVGESVGKSTCFRTNCMILGLTYQHWQLPLSIAASNVKCWYQLTKTHRFWRSDHVVYLFWISYHVRFFYNLKNTYNKVGCLRSE